MSLPTPIGMSDRRLPQAGRIRIGQKTKARRGRESIDTFKFTSSDVDLLRPLAARYGGVVEAWNEPSSGDKWALRSEATKINVVLPPNPLSECYEKWDPHLVRRCNGGATPDGCTLLVGTADDAEYQQVPCVCARKGVLECTYKLRLSVLLAEVQSLGTWRLDTSSEHAQKEMPAVVEAIMGLQDRGFHQAVLRLETRRKPGKVFNVPVLDPGISIESLLAGGSRLVQLPTPSSPAVGELGAGASSVTQPTSTPEAGEPMIGEAGEERPAPPVGPSPASPPTDDDIVDAEVVEDDDLRDWLNKLPATHRNAALRKAREIARAHGEPEPTVASAIPNHILELLKAGDDEYTRAGHEG